MTYKILFIAIVFLGNACAHKFGLTESDGVTLGKVIKVSGVNVIDKKRKFSVKMNIENISQKSIVINLNNIKCFKGNRQGVIQHVFFGAGERYMDFAPGVAKSYNLLCFFNGLELPKGDDYIFHFSVWENPSGDGRTLGEPLLKDGEWKIPYREN